MRERVLKREPGYLPSFFFPLIFPSFFPSFFFSLDFFSSTHPQQPVSLELAHRAQVPPRPQAVAPPSFYRVLGGRGGLGDEQGGSSYGCCSCCCLGGGDAGRSGLSVVGLLIVVFAALAVARCRIRDERPSAVATRQCWTLPAARGGHGSSASCQGAQQHRRR